MLVEQVRRTRPHLIIFDQAENLTQVGERTLVQLIGGENGVILGGRRGIGDLGLTDLGSAHGRWRLAASLTLGLDRVEEYDRVR